MRGRKLAPSLSQRRGRLPIRARCDELGCSQRLLSEGLQVDVGAVQACAKPLDDPPFPDGCLVEAGAVGEPTGTVARVPLHQFEGVPAHEDAEVKLRLGEEPVGVNELVAGAGLERVALVNVAVDKDGALVVVGGDATLGAGERVRQRPLGAGAIELPPRGRDELDQPAAFLRARREAAIRRRSPETLGGRAQDLVPLRERQAHVEEGRSEAFDEHGAALAAQDKACDSRIADIQAEIDRLIAPYQERIEIYELRKRAIEHRREYQKYMVGELLAALKTDTFVLPTGKKVYIQETESCEVTASQEEIAVWPEKFRRVKYEADKKALKSADGEWLPSGVTFIKKRTVRYPK